MAKPLLVSFEGIEGSGKSTQIQMVFEKLLSEGYDVVRSREPGGSLIGEGIRHLLLESKYQKEMDAHIELLLLLAARKAHLNATILPALKRGCIVLLDRFIDASIAYQGYGRDLGENYIRQAHQMFEIDIAPDLTIFLDLSLDLSFDRITQRSSHNLDRIELAGSVFFEKVYQGYQNLAARGERRWCKLSADDTPQNLTMRIINEIKKLL